MIEPLSIPALQALWPTFVEQGNRRGVDPKLLLAIAYIQSGLEAQAPTTDVAGIMPMTPAAAQEVAHSLGRSTYDLREPATSIEFAAFYLASMQKRFGLPKLALAAYLGRPEAVQEAGAQVPPDGDVQRDVTAIMVLWRWLQQNLDPLLSTPASASVTISSSTTAAVVQMPAPSTVSTSSGSSQTLPPPAWRLIVPPDNWQQPVPVDVAQLSTLEEVATRLKLVFRRDDDTHKVYLGMPRADKPVPPNGGRLILPVPGADASNNGGYQADSGLDVIVPVGTPVVAAGSGTIIYSEPGHTSWSIPPDTANSILIALDTPFQYKNQTMPFTWYTHLSRLRYHVADGSPGRHVAQGELIGWTGIGNRVPHLHFGVVQDRAQTVFVPPSALASYFGWTRP